MPKVGMEPVRRAALVEATIAEIGTHGSLDVTVSQIARRAGVSSALAHHYFGSKEQIFLAAMRQVLTVYGTEVRAALRHARTPRARLEAVITAGFSPENFRHEVVAAWLNFYVLASTSTEARRLLSVYQRRLHANLVHDLRPLVGPRAEGAAERIAGLIDGLYLRCALARRGMDGEEAAAHVAAMLEHELEAAA
ncbi:MAG: transcriptional regulator BetI [Pseudomonadota bacterium]